MSIGAYFRPPFFWYYLHDDAEVHTRINAPDRDTHIF